MYAFFERVLDDRRHFPAFDAIENIRKLAMASGGYAEVADHGTGRSGRTMLRDLARRSACSSAQGRMLFRIARWRQPATILELGTSIGIGTAYLASACPGSRVVSVEGAPEVADIARAHMKLLGLNHVDVQTGRFEDVLPALLPELRPIDLVYFDGNHRRQATLDYLEACLPWIHPDALLVFDDIHWSADMEDAWLAIRRHPKIRMTIDCFDFGVASCATQFYEKQHFTAIPLRLKPWKIF
ncbi:MAG: class I SAM-dependent methyltransferase [Saprospiraceae bacterium]|nr:class I SAM-dependent methyltransferase [Saprospiraceae bacterium]